MHVPRRFVRLSAALLMVSASSAAYAHPGDHSLLDAWELLAHLAEPDHLAILAVTLMIVAAGVRALWVRSAQSKAAARRRQDERQ